MDICFLEALKKKNNKKRKSEGDGLYKVSWKICLKERDRQKNKERGPQYERNKEAQME